MATVSPPADQAANLLQKLSLDSQAKTFEVPDVTKKGSANSGKVANGTQSDRSVTPMLSDVMDPPVCYLPNNYASPGYYYSGYDGSTNEWDEYAKYMSSDGLEITSGVYGDSRSLVYPGYGYTPYGPYSPSASPVPTMGYDQMYGSQHYQYPSPYFQSLAPCGSYPTMSTLEKGDISPTADQVPLTTDAANSKSNGVPCNGGMKVNNGSLSTRAPNQSTYMPWMETPYFSDGLPRPITSSAMNSSISNGNGVPPMRNQNIRTNQMCSHNPRSGMNFPYGYMNKLYPYKLYGQGNAYRSSIGYGCYGYDSRTNARDWMSIDGKYKPRGRLNGYGSYGTDCVDDLNELNRGPRAKSSKNLKGFTPTAVIIKGQNIPLSCTVNSEKEKSATSPDREQYNSSDFPETYSDAKFFIIKSYSEDDVHKSIKYNVWASTPNGNKKLDGAYLDAQSKSGGCPVFLFFSVNASGQFVGVAEMTGPVDFNKNVEYWQQDKWIGCFPVKWHIVKDVPNNILKHITVETNENKPVTNSRDTQEIKLELGLQMIKIFKDHSSKQCILDDFDFYEDRQKRIQEKKAKQQQFLKQAQEWVGKPAEEKLEKSTDGDINHSNSVQSVSDSDEQAVSSNNSLTKSVKPASALSEKPISNENGC